MILVDCDEDHLRAINIITAPAEDIPYRGTQASSRIARAAIEQLSAYFNGSLTTFDLPLQPVSSARGEALRQAICAIPFGQMMSYGAVARMIGSGPRAIGQACRRNPLPIIVPCHRVTAAAGAIGNYSGGNGVETKLKLLRHERAIENTLFESIG
nr:methylated-DNA--[protein]-cysteine S-methyltransferase [Sphingomonas sp. YR710]